MARLAARRAGERVFFLIESRTTDAGPEGRACALCDAYAIGYRVAWWESRAGAWKFVSS